MRGLDEWAEEYWDVMAMAASLTAALVVALGLSVAYNVAVTRVDAPAAPLSEPAAPAAADDREPRWSDADASAPGLAMIGQASSAVRSPSEST